MCRRICRVYGSVYLLCRMFGLDESLTVSLLPKSVTTPIAVSIAEPAGGMVPITVIDIRIVYGDPGRDLRTAAYPAVPRV